MRWEEVGRNRGMFIVDVGKRINNHLPHTRGKERVEILHVCIQMYCQLDDAQLARLRDSYIVLH